MIKVIIKNSWENVEPVREFTIYNNWDNLKQEIEDIDLNEHKVLLEMEDNCWDGEYIGRSIIEPLLVFSNFTLQELTENKEYSNLLIFSHSKLKNESHLLDLPVFSHNIIDKDIVRIKTGNVMGFIGARNVQVKIRSRFDSDEHDFFLHYLLEKVFHLNLVQLRYGNANVQVLDFLYLMFPYFLKKAVKQGILRQYVNKSCNDYSVKGTINVPMHLRQNIPFMGKVAYTSHEYSTDNPLTQLVRHTIEHIRNKLIGKHILYDGENRKAVREIVSATPSYNAEERQKVIRINSRPVAHPYYTAYEDLKKICLQILTHNKMSYKDGKPTINGILFDGAWLWEEYVATILPDFKHPRNDIRDGGIRMFDEPAKESEDIVTNSNRKIYPDFYKKEGDKMQYILDAKYKRQNEKGIYREDLYQVIAYMYTTECKWGGYIYPCQKNENDTPYRCYQLAGYGGMVSSVPVLIPPHNEEYSQDQKSIDEAYQRFREQMGIVEDGIREAFCKWKFYEKSLILNPEALK